MTGQPDPDRSRNTLFGKYELEVEYPAGSLPVSTTAMSTMSPGHAEERFEYRVGRVHFLLHDGRLTLNGTDRGTVRAGDRIRLAADGRLFVNDQERR